MDICHFCRTLRRVRRPYYYKLDCSAPYGHSRQGRCRWSGVGDGLLAPRSEW